MSDMLCLRKKMGSENECVPVFNVPQNIPDRFVNVQNLFYDRFKKNPNFFVRVPGRVNLIGEHIDYSGYGVCPMALRQDIVLAVSTLPKNKKLILVNVDSTYSDFECNLDDFNIEESGSPSWYQYFLCGVKGIIEVLPKGTVLMGAQIAVDGNIPQSAGLSSSSALVSAAALAVATVYGLGISRKELANLCASCERYIGTQGGGMDQAIAFLATEGCAKYIEFSPLHATDVLLPSDAVFVIAHSLVEINKAATSDFNCRVAECRLATQVLAKSEGLNWKEIKTLSALQKKLNLSLADLANLVKKTLHDQPYTKEELLEVLEISNECLQQLCLTSNTTHISSFKLRQRALHVVGEAMRVKKFHEICQTSQKDSLSELGQLLYESHDSLKNSYECSHPQLDRIVELSRKSCFGARLTGAGWGGCVVALTCQGNVQKFIDLLKNDFYVGDQDVDRFVFVTSPQSGASVYLNGK